jgi:hypothetical protein
VNGSNVTFTSALSAPAWDATKKYRITYAPYASCQATQQDHAFQADDADERIQDDEAAHHLSADVEQRTYFPADSTIKGEFVPNSRFGDGVSMDVGTDYALAATSNAYHDYKSAHQAPGLWSEAKIPVDGDGSGSTWLTRMMGPIFLGTEQLTTTVSRVLTVAPFYRCSVGASTGSIRVTLSRMIPVESPGENLGVLGSSRFTDHFTQATWTTSSTTFATGEDQELSIAVKDLFFGFAWITIETSGYGQTRGLAKCHEGPRVVSEVG